MAGRAGVQMKGSRFQHDTAEYVRENFVGVVSRRGVISGGLDVSEA